MNAVSKIRPDAEAHVDPLAKMREPFPANQISKLPKPTAQQTKDVKDDYKKGHRCALCGSWHHRDVVHLDYVGHAALTDRLLDADPNWYWEPVAFGPDGLPAFDRSGGLWIKLTVGGVTRLGYGNAKGKEGQDPGSREKEVIGDCLVTGTLITTARGDIPIESVEIGDLVPTRAGWRPVIDHWLSAPSAPVVTVRLSNGRSITGTPHHKVPTIEGDKRLSALRTGDTMHGWLDTENCRAQKRSNGAVGAIGATRRISPSTAGGTSWPRPILEPIYTAISTRRLAGKYPLAGTFTTRMRTGITTALTTLSRLILKNTEAFTPPARFAFAGSATSAVNRSTPPSLAHAGAPRHARSAAGAATGSRMCAPNLERRNESFIARSAARPSDQPSRGLGFAPLTVVEVLDAGLGEIWNLSVEEVHEYVANGVLVYNCLRNAAMRFGAALDLWHKGDLHADAESSEQGDTRTPAAVELAIRAICDCQTPDEFKALWAKNYEGWKAVLDAPDYAKVQRAKNDMVEKFKRVVEAEKSKGGEPETPFDDPLDDILPNDEIPY